MKRAFGLHEERQTATVRAFFREVYPGRESVREQEISALPIKEWKGRKLRTIQCHGTRGKGNHFVHVPESLLWNLISLDNYCCPYHAGDNIIPPEKP